MPDEMKSGETEDKKVEANAEEAKAGSEEQKHETEFSSVEDALAEVERLRNINKDIIQSRDKAKGKLREYVDAEEKRTAESLEEQGKYKELYESQNEKFAALQNKLKNNAVESALEKALSEAGAEVKTALKLVDKSELEVDDDYNIDMSKVKDVVAKLKDDHAILFAKIEDGDTKPKAPDAKRAEEEEAKGGYTEELKALMKNPRATQSDFDAIRTKYGRK